MNLAKNVKKMRKKKGWSQVQLSKKIGCHVNHINRIETNKYIPSLEVVVKIAEVFKVSLDQLVYDSSGVIGEITLEDSSFNEKIRLLNSLNDEEKKVVSQVIDALLTKKQMASLLQ